jgi:O-antigen/teichoic acid export membrane protein
MFELVKNKVNEYARKYQIDLPYLIRNEFWVYLRFGASLLIGIAISVAFARLASKEIYGQYNYLISILAIVSILSIPGLKNAVLVSTARGNDGNYRPAVKTSFLWSLLGVPVLLATGAYYFYYNTQIVGVCLMISSVFFPFIYAPSIWDSFLAGKKRFDLTARYGSIQLTINAATVIAILSFAAENLVLIFYTYLVASFSVNSVLYWKSLKYIGNDRKDEGCQKYGYFLTTTNVAGNVAKHIDKILIGTLLGGLFPHHPQNQPTGDQDSGGAGKAERPDFATGNYSAGRFNLILVFHR